MNLFFLVLVAVLPLGSDSSALPLNSHTCLNSSRRSVQAQHAEVAASLFSEHLLPYAMMYSSFATHYARATEDMLAVTAAIHSSQNVGQVFYCHGNPSFLDVTATNASESIKELATSHKIEFIQGTHPSCDLHDTDSLFVDPINFTVSNRIRDEHYVYLFPTVGQQFYALASYVARMEASSSIYPVFRDNGLLDHTMLLDGLELAVSYFKLPLKPMTTFTSTVVNALHVDGINVVVGLTNADLVPLAHFLDEHPLATVMINFDELTLLYDAIRASFREIPRSSTGRLVYATNLPRWTTPPTDPRAVVLSLFFRTFDKSLWTPAALRTFLTTAVMDFLAYDVAGKGTTLRDEIFSENVIAVDASIEVGPFIPICLFPSRRKDACLDNAGARSLYVWSLANAMFAAHARPLYGPVDVAKVEDPDDYMLYLIDTNYTNPWLLLVWMLLIPMAASLLGGWLLCETSCLWGDLPIQATVGFVAVRRGSANIRPSKLEALLSELSDQVALLVKKHHCVEVECTSHSFAVVGRSADDVVHLMQELHDAQQKLCESHNVSKLVDFRVGVHTALCSVERAWLNGDVTALFCAVAPLLMLARCVADISLPKEVWATQWTVQALHSAMKVKVAGVYRLDDECTSVTVFRI